MNRLFRTLLCLCALTLLSACQQHYHFDKQWRTWAAVTPKDSKVFPKKTTPPPPPQSPWDGRWAGHWTSDKRKALFSSKPSSGEIRCIITHLDPYQYRANFRAEFESIFHGEYVGIIYGHPRGKTFHAKGRWRLGPLAGGDYYYEGTMTPSEVNLHYNSRYDNGTIQMSKVP